LKNPPEGCEPSGGFDETATPVTSRTIANQDYYKILQIDPDAEQEIVQAAYRRLALKYHPATNESIEANPRMQEINEALEHSLSALQAEQEKYQ
jgi:DnaJ-class molecular chaperone